MNPTKQWNADLYDDKMNFVSHYGRGLIDWLQPLSTERILDIGCGTGDLTAELAKSGSTVMGVDFSADMIRSAQQKYPHLPFQVADAHTYHTEKQFDAIFSNAALHWMKMPEKVIESVWHALAPKGRFVAEFGGKGNCELVVDALRVALAQKGISADERMPWYFPSIGEYAALLEKQGFRVVLASHFNRPTTMPDGDHGLRHWLDSFCSPFFTDMSADEINDVCLHVTVLLRPALFHDGKWIVDYKRIRVIAIKTNE